MATEEEVTEAIDELNDQIAGVADDMDRWSQEQSAEIYEEIANVSNMRARTIRQEMED